MLLLGMLVAFTLAVLHRAWIIHTVQAIPFCTVRFNCGCGTGEVLICGKLIENTALILLSAWLLLGHGRQFCARYRLTQSE